MRRAAQQGDRGALHDLGHRVIEKCARKESGRILFEMGLAFKCYEGWESEVVESDLYNAFRQALRVYDDACIGAKSAIWCWIWMARGMGVARDIRLMIADLIWDERSVWSENKIEEEKEK